MNISKIKLGWTAVCGLLNPFGSMLGNIVDYLLDVLNRALAGLTDNTKEKIGTVIVTAKNVMDILLKIQLFIPTKWQYAYRETVESVQTVIDSLEDLELTSAELSAIRKEFGEAVAAWKDDGDCASCVALVGIALVCGLAVALCGCKAFYENAGSHTKVGSLTAPIEVSDGSDSITVKALYSMDGADVYTAKDSLVKIKYRNAYTNDYFAIVKTRGVQDLEVEIEPLDCSGGSETNAVSAAEE